MGLLCVSNLVSKFLDNNGVLLHRGISSSRLWLHTVIVDFCLFIGFAENIKKII